MMIESTRWMKHYYKQDIRDMRDYAVREQQKLRLLKQLKRKRHSPLTGFLLWSELRSSRYDRDYFRRSLKSDKKKLKRLV
jgi:benzoyl-CoA reductase/2-hydroxyglutaryl-CoA dehydratase subunit BcrC/BadD/HgdB